MSTPVIVVPTTFDMWTAARAARSCGHPPPQRLVEPLRFFRGDTAQVPFQVVNALNGGPLNVSGWTFWLTAKYAVPNPDARAPVAIDNIAGGRGGVTVLDAPTGMVVGVIPALATRGFADGPTALEYDVQGQDGSGVVTTLQRGVMVFEPDVTRAVAPEPYTPPPCPTPYQPPCPPAPPRFRPISQVTWWVDPVGGNDLADGLTSRTPIKTWTSKPDGTPGCYVSRTGPDPFINQPVNYYLMGDLPVTDQMSLLGVMGPGGQVLVHGVPGVKRTGTLGTVMQRDPSTNTRDQLTDANGAVDWTGDVGLLVEVQASTVRSFEGQSVSGPTRGWIAKAELGPNLADMSVMCSSAYTPFTPYQGPLPGPFEAGDSYSVLVLPKVYNLVVDPRLGLNNVSGPNFAELVDFQGSSTAGFQVMSAIQDWAFSDCNTNFLFAQGGYFWDCQFTSGFVWEMQVTTTFGLVPAGGFCLSDGGVLFTYGLMLQGPGTQISCDGAGGNGELAWIQNHHQSYGLGIYDCDTPLILGAGSMLGCEASLYGTGITTCVINLAQGGAVYDADAYTIGRPYCVATGAPSDIIINNQTSLPAMDPTTYALTGLRALTFANLFRTVVAGGFEGVAFDPRSPGTRYEFAHP
jgi:hypothetical protein